MQDSFSFGMPIAMNKFYALIASCLLISSADAALLTFDEQPNLFDVETVSEGDYTFSKSSGSLGTNSDRRRPTNGTTHLMSWTNQGEVSGFDLSHSTGRLFDVLAFDFSGGYFGMPEFLPTQTLSLSGWLGGEMVRSVSFQADSDFLNGAGYTTLSLTAFTGIDLLRAEAYGTNNRASFDNFVVYAEGETRPVPAPASLALMLLGLAGLLASGHRRK